MAASEVRWNELRKMLTPGRLWTLIGTLASVLGIAFGFGMRIQAERGNIALGHKDSDIAAIKQSGEVELARHKEAEERGSTLIQHLRDQINAASDNVPLDITGQTYMLSTGTMFIPRKDAQSLLAAQKVKYIVRGDMLLPDYSDIGWRDNGQLRLAQIWSATYTHEIEFLDENELSEAKNPLWAAKCWMFESQSSSNEPSSRCVCVAGTCSTGMQWRILSYMLTSNVARTSSAISSNTQQVSKQPKPNDESNSFFKAVFDFPLSSLLDFTLPYTKTKFQDMHMTSAYFSPGILFVTAENHSSLHNNTSEIAFLSLVKNDTVYFFLAAGQASTPLSADLIAGRRWIRLARVTE